MTFAEWWEKNSRDYPASIGPAEELWDAAQKAQREDTAERAREMAIEWCHVAPDEYPADLNTALDFADALAEELAPSPEGAKPQAALPLPKTPAWAKALRAELANELKGIEWARHCLAINAGDIVSARILKLRAQLREPLPQRKRRNAG
jgi:hypothetical protein